MRGFTLIEVMVSLLILSVVILGLVSFQLTSLQEARVPGRYHQVTLLANEIVDRIRVNQAALQTYLNKVPNKAKAIKACQPFDTGGGDCSMEQRAENDLYEWHQTVSELPAGQLSFCRGVMTANDQRNCNSNNSSENPVYLQISWKNTSQLVEDTDPEAEGELVLLVAI